MSITNAFTARAATQTVQAPLRPMRLLGVFRNDTNDYVLMQTRDGQTVRLSRLIPAHGLRLVDLVDGWAMIEENSTLHRLIIG